MIEDLMGLQSDRDYVTVRMPRDRLVLPIKGTVQGTRSWMPTFSDLFESFSYKPGYEFILLHPNSDLFPDLVYQPPEGRGSRIMLKCHVPDSTKPPHEPYMLQFSMYVPHYVEHHDRGYQLHFLRMVFEEFEHHEIDEWFRVDGELVKNPHAPQV